MMAPEDRFTVFGVMLPGAAQRQAAPRRRFQHSTASETNFSSENWLGGSEWRKRGREWDLLVRRWKGILY